MKNKKIIFEPMSESFFVTENYPRSSINFIPEWYKKIKPYVNNTENKEVIFHKYSSSDTNATFKKCTPFLDAMSLGYTIGFYADTEVERKANGLYDFRWRIPYTDYIEGHAEDIYKGIPIIYDNDKSILKFIFDCKIITPPGYSCLYTHPFNRHDLPFRTFSGIVDTDLYPDSVHFPFQMLSSTEDNFVIPAKTPICQLFPFKRESWESSKLPLNSINKKIAITKVLSKINNTYKTQFWHKKSFK